MQIRTNPTVRSNPKGLSFVYKVTNYSQCLKWKNRSKVTVHSSLDHCPFVVVGCIGLSDLKIIPFLEPGNVHTSQLAVH